MASEDGVYVEKENNGFIRLESDKIRSFADTMTGEYYRRAETAHRMSCVDSRCVDSEWRTVTRRGSLCQKQPLETKPASQSLIELAERVKELEKRESLLLKEASLNSQAQLDFVKGNSIKLKSFIQSNLNPDCVMFVSKETIDFIIERLDIMSL